MLLVSKFNFELLEILYKLICNRTLAFSTVKYAWKAYPLARNKSFTWLFSYLLWTYVLKQKNSIIKWKLAGEKTLPTNLRLHGEYQIFEICDESFREAPNVVDYILWFHAIRHCFCLRAAHEHLYSQVSKLSHFGEQFIFVFRFAFIVICSWFVTWMTFKLANSYGFSISCTDFLSFHRLTGVGAFPYGFIYLQNHSFFFVWYADFVRYCQTTTLNKCPKPYN